MNEQEIIEKTDMSEAIKELNDDSLDTNNMSKIDMKARLNPHDMPSILAIDNLVAMNVLPKSFLQLTRQKKRLSVSILGKGREEIVKIARGNHDEDVKQKKTLANFFSRGDKQ